MVATLKKTKKGWIVLAPELGWIPCNCKAHEGETEPPLREFSEVSKTKADAIAYAKYLGAKEIKFT